MSTFTQNANTSLTKGFFWAFEPWIKVSQSHRLIWIKGSWWLVFLSRTSNCRPGGASASLYLWSSISHFHVLYAECEKTLNHKFQHDSVSYSFCYDLQQPSLRQVMFPHCLQNIVQTVIHHLILKVWHRDKTLSQVKCWYLPSTARRRPAGSEDHLCRFPLRLSSRTASASDQWSSGKLSPSPCGETNMRRLGSEMRQFSVSIIISVAVKCKSS